MSIKKREAPVGKWRTWLKTKLVEVLASLPRLVLALLLALVIAKPLELELFQPEVELEVMDIKSEMEDAAHKISAQPVANSGLNDQNNQLDRIAAMRAENAKLNEEIDKAYREWQTLNELARKELAGEKGEASNDLTGKPGAGHDWRYRQAAAAEAKTSYERIKEKNSPQIKQTTDALNQLLAVQLAAQQTIATQASEKRIAVDGLAIRLAALSQLTSKDSIAPYRDFSVYRVQGPVYRYANWGIIAILALLELAPILSKIFISYGPYDRAVEMEEEKARLMGELEQMKLRAAIDTLKSSREKRVRAMLDIQDAMLTNLKDEIQNVTEDSQISKSELNEMKRVLIRQAIADLRTGYGDGLKR
jgi:hypothetical protein